MSILHGAHAAAKPKLPKVLACPFCGARAQLQTWKEGRSKIRTPYWRGAVRCTNSACGCSTPIIRAPEAAIHLWNQRTDAERTAPAETTAIVTEQN